MSRHRRIVPTPMNFNAGDQLDQRRPVGLPGTHRIPNDTGRESGQQEANINLVAPDRILIDFEYHSGRIWCMRASSFGLRPSARMGLCQWITLIEHRPMRDAYTIHWWDVLDRTNNILERSRNLDIPKLPPRSCCGAVTGIWCDFCKSEAICSVACGPVHNSLQVTTWVSSRISDYPSICKGLSKMQL